MLDLMAQKREEEEQSGFMSLRYATQSSAGNPADPAAPITTGASPAPAAAAVPPVLFHSPPLLLPPSPLTEASRNPAMCKEQTHSRRNRFHPLSEFDEGKRSCRRRLAGHNRRRRKTQLEDASSRLALPGNLENGVNGNIDIPNLLAILARLQGKNSDKQLAIPSLADKDQIIQLLSKMHPMPSTNSASMSPESSCIDLNVSQASQPESPEQPSKANGNPTAPSTMDLLEVFSAGLARSEPRMSPPQVNSHSSGNNMNRPG